jgi:hypothetical protein
VAGPNLKEKLMQTLLASILGLTALASVALADEPTQLTLDQMDQVTAGQASAGATASSIASGPMSAMVTTDTTADTAVVGGLSPSNTASATSSSDSSSE